VRLSLPGSAGALDVAIDAHNRIIIAGYSDDDFGFVRLKANGSYDTQFGASRNGKVTINFSGSDEIATKILMQGNKIVLVGGGGKDFAAVRLDQYGRLDPTFGERVGNAGTERVRVNLSAEDISLDAATLYDGSIVMVGGAGGANAIRTRMVLSLTETKATLVWYVLIPTAETRRTQGSVWKDSITQLRLFVMKMIDSM